MKVLGTNKRYLKIAALLPSGEIPKFTDKLWKFCTKFVIIILHCTGMMANMFFIYHNPNNIDGAVNAFTNTFAGLSSLGSYFGFMLNEKNISCLNEELSNIIDTGEMK